MWNVLAIVNNWEEMQAFPFRAFLVKVDVGKQTSKLQDFVLWQSEADFSARYIKKIAWKWASDIQGTWSCNFRGLHKIVQL